MRSAHRWILAAVVSGSALVAQVAPGGSLDQQLKQQYPAGTVLVVKKKGIFGVNGECPIVPAATFKEGKLHRLGLLQATAAASNQCASRAFPVGSSLTLAGTMVEPKYSRVDLGFYDPLDGFKAQLWFAFAKGALPATDFKAIQDAISEVFSIENGAPAQQQAEQQPQAPPQQQAPPPPQAPAQPQAPLVAPSLGPIYVNSEIAGDRLQLNPGGSFSLTEAGQAFQGNYSINGNVLKLHIVQLNKDVDITIDGEKLIVNGSEIWVQPKEDSEIEHLLRESE